MATYCNTKALDKSIPVSRIGPSGQGKRILLPGLPKQDFSPSCNHSTRPA